MYPVLLKIHVIISSINLKKLLDKKNLLDFHMETVVGLHCIVYFSFLISYLYFASKEYNWERIRRLGWCPDVKLQPSCIIKYITFTFIFLVQMLHSNIQSRWLQSSFLYSCVTKFCDCFLTFHEGLHPAFFWMRDKISFASRPLNSNWTFRFHGYQHGVQNTIL